MWRAPKIRPSSGVAPANQTKERSVHELFASAFRNKSSKCESCLFSQGKTPEFTQKWAKFMNFSYWPFFWFGLPGRLLRLQKDSNFRDTNISAKIFGPNFFGAPLVMGVRVKILVFFPRFRAHDSRFPPQIRLQYLKRGGWKWPTNRTGANRTGEPRPLDWMPMSQYFNTAGS